MSKLICPRCGGEVVLPEHEHLTMGMSLAKNTDNNTYYLNMANTTEYSTNNANTKESKTMGRVAERIETLKNNGIDTSKYFAMTTPNGEEIAMKWENGIPVPFNIDEITDIDEIEEEIYANGYVKNTKLHRRWVMAQMFHALNYKAYRWTDHLGIQHVNGKDGFYGWLERHGYHYQWKMALEEVRVLSKIEGVDNEAFNERSKFFTKDVILNMISDYRKELEKMIKNLPTRKCKGIDYKRIPHYGNVFCSDIRRKVINPIYKTYNRIASAKNYRDIYWMLNSFLNKRWGLYITLSCNTKMSKSFIDAYKGEGAYYTLKNMVLFHNVEIVDYYTGEVLRGQQAYKYLQRMNDRYQYEGYKMFALLKKTIEDNNFDFDKSIREN